MLEIAFCHIRIHIVGCALEKSCLSCLRNLHCYVRGQTMERDSCSNGLSITSWEIKMGNELATTMTET